MKSNVSVPSLKCPPPSIFLILSQMNSIYALATDFIKIPFNIVLSYTLRSSKLSLSLTFPNQTRIWTYCLCLIRTIFPTHHIILGFITRIIFGDGYISWSSSLCSLLHSPATSNALDPNILLSAYSWTPSGNFPLSVWATKFHNHKKTRGEIIVLYILIFIFLDSKLKDGWLFKKW